MKILVCVKQVSDPETNYIVDEERGWIRPEGQVKYWMNHPDEFAVEEAVLIKESFPEVLIDVLTVGPERAAQILERAMGMGADNGIHIFASDEGYLSPLVIASWIAAYAKDMQYDLILTGVLAEDDMQGQVGPLLAELLSIPCATSVIFEEVHQHRKTIYVEREIEGGQRDMVELVLPAVLTIQTGINKPRYPSLSNLLRAKKQKALVVDPDTFPSVTHRESVVKADYPRKSGSGIILEGDQKEKAVKLIQILKEKAYF
jgi:electron transfer flavoprotein beta subunit